MKAARLLEPGRVEWQDAPEPTVDGPGQVLVRTKWATICGSDLHNIFAGTTLDPYPCRFGYPGHESVGEVVESTADGIEPGQLVLSVPDLSCSAAFADLQLVPERFIVPIDSTDQIEHVVLAQQLGTVIYAMKRFWPHAEPQQTATVIGAGTAGCFFVHLLRAAGFEQIVVSDVIPERTERAKRFGADVTVVASHQSDDTAIVDATLELTGGNGADLVIEAAGEDATRAQALDAVRVDGRVGLFGTPSSLGPVPFPVNTLFRKKPTLECSHSAQHETGHTSFRQAIELIQSGAIAVDEIITHRIDPASVANGLELALHPTNDSLKVALVWP
jgi:2-desacetyl-2-hydroxyethyl bacteriochlorophyllide A dehydrogenase